MGCVGIRSTNTNRERKKTNQREKERNIIRRFAHVWAVKGYCVN